MDIEYKVLSAASDLLTTEELARLTCTSTSFWEKLRLQGGTGSLQFVRIGRSIRYRRADVEAWLSKHVACSTSERGSA